MEIAELYKIYLQHPSVQTDTRRLQQGGIYFALSGANFDGNTFAAQAIEKGAAYAVIDNDAYAASEQYIVMENVLETLQQLALHHRRQFTIPFIAITGSNGKTTTKELVAAVLSSQFITYATEGNLNNHIGVPLTILKIKQDAEMAIIEMGANHQREIAGYCKVAEPTHGIITNCGKAHIEGFGGIEGVKKGKGELYDYLRENAGIIFRNTDLDYLESMALGIAEQATYGTTNATYTGRLEMDGVFVQAVVDNGDDEVTVATHLVGAYNFPNVMTAIAVGLHFGVSIEMISEAIGKYNPDNSRSQWVQKGTNKIILDAYNANPTSMRAAILNFNRLELPNKMLWIGGMKEMGPEERNEHLELVSLITQYAWADVILVGKEFAGISEDFKWFENSGEAAAYIKANQPQDSSILVKGSRGSKMELMVEALTPNP